MFRNPSGSVLSNAEGYESEGDNDLLPSSSSTSTKPLPPTKPQNTEKSSAPPPKSNSTVQKAFEATGFKSVNGDYQLQGRLGIALLAGVDKLEFKLLVYASGNVIVTQAVITTSFQLSVTGLYVSCYDAFNQNWSFLFESEDKVDDFVRFVTIARFRTDKCASIVYTDKVAGSGEKLSIDDSVEIRYSGWILQGNGTLGPVFETKNASNGKPLRFKVGKGKSLKVWDEGLIGMQRGTHRLLVVPSSKAYGSKGFPPKVPGGSNIVFDVEVVRLRIASSNAADSQPKMDEAIATDSVSKSRGNSHTDETPLPQLPNDEDFESDDTFKIRSRSISEKLEGKPTKQNLLSRMAKMGQAMIPQAQATGAQGTEESDDLEGRENSVSADPLQPIQSQPATILSQKVIQPVYAQDTPNMQYPQHNAAIGFQSYNPLVSQSFPVTMNPYHHNPHSIQSNQQVLPYSSVSVGIPRDTFPTSQANEIYHQRPQAAPISSNTDQIHTAMLVNETRQQNTEVRISIAKLQDKLDTVSTKVDEQLKNTNRVMVHQPTVPTMENTVLLQNLTRIIQENEQLKEEVLNKSGKIEKQNLKITELLTKNETILEENNQSIERNAESYKMNASQSHTKVLELEMQKLNLIQDLSKRTSQVYDLQVSLDEKKEQISSLTKQLESSNVKYEALGREMSDAQEGNADLRESLAEIKTHSKDEKGEIRSFERKIQDLVEREEEMTQKFNSKEKSLKQKLARIKEEKQALADELDKFKTLNEKEKEELHESLRRERASGHNSESVLKNEIEKEVADQWKKRCDQLVKAEAERFERRLLEAEEDKSRLQEENVTLLSKLQLMKDQTREMKRNLQEEINRLSAACETAADDAKSSRNTSNEMTTENAGDLTSKVRIIMNSVYRSIRENIASSEQYEGSKIHQIVMEIIRETTLQLTEETHSDNDEDESSSEDNEEEKEEADRKLIDSKNDNQDSEEDIDEEEVENETAVGHVLKLDKEHNIYVNKSVKDNSENGQSSDNDSNLENEAPSISPPELPPIAPGLDRVISPVPPSNSIHQVEQNPQPSSDSDPDKAENLQESITPDNTQNVETPNDKSPTEDRPKESESKPLFNDDED